jgi:hypothetical protein
VGSGRGRSEGAELEGENNRGGGAEGLKEVLRREIQGLKVWPVYRSQVFSITGTYLCFIL